MGDYYTKNLFPLASPEQVLAESRKLYAPEKTYCLFSGGKDSLCSTHFGMTNGADAVVHINTGIGIEETREFVRETCKKYGWPLIERHPPEKTYEDFVLEYGFPGPNAHRYAYIWLKERALNKLIQESKTSRRSHISLITGVRNFESARRMGHVKPINKQGSKIWVAPLFSFSKIDLHEYIEKHNLEVNPVSQVFGMSGECLCGAYAHDNEIQEIEKLYPKVAEQIHNLEEKVEKTGNPLCVWGHQGKISVKNDDFDDLYVPFMPMCVGCSQSKKRE